MDPTNLNTCYPELADHKKTFSEIIDFYQAASNANTHRPQVRLAYNALAQVTSWLETQSYAQLISLYGALGMTSIFLASDHLLEGSCIVYGYDDDENSGFLITFRSPILKFPRFVNSVCCSQYHLQIELERVLATHLIPHYE